MLCGFLVCAASEAEAAQSTASIYGLVMVPSGPEANDHSDAGGGVGLRFTSPADWMGSIFALTGGIDYASLASETANLSGYEDHSLARQQNSQSYARLYIGGEIGGHGNGFLRPHIGADFAILGSWTYRRVEVLDPHSNEWETDNVQKFRFRPSLGVDLTVGLDLNVSRSFSLDFGFRALRSLFVPLQLGSETVTVYPQYGEVYVGATFLIPTGTEEQE